MHAVSSAISISEETKIKGQVICARNGVYQVECNNAVLDFYARGKIKFDKNEVLTGDFVEVSDGAVTKVYPRFSRFSRPNVANVECLIIVLCDKPSPDYLILDKLLLSATYAEVEYAVAVNKSDRSNECYNYLIREYPFLKNLFCVSAENGDGINELKRFIRSKLVAFAGQSAVGKTSLINRLTDSEFLTGKLSRKTERGKHTTTYSKIIRTEDFSVIDTPGFSELYADVKPADVPTNFQPYDEYINDCKFSDCTHIDEPECAVKSAIEKGVLSKERYERYKTIYKEILAEYKNRYDK